MAVKVRCPLCRGAFPWDAALPLPEKCPLPRCEYVSTPRPQREDGVIEITAPFIRSARMKATDTTYRQLEESSAARAQMAADQLGVPVSEMSHLKVTNLKDNTREGEIAAMPVVNDVTRQMDLIKARGGQVGFAQQGPDFAAQAQAVAPKAGIKAMEGIQARFGNR